MACSIAKRLPSRGRCATRAIAQERTLIRRWPRACRARTSRSPRCRRATRRLRDGAENGSCALPLPTAMRAPLVVDRRRRARRRLHRRPCTEPSMITYGGVKSDLWSRAWDRSRSERDVQARARERLNTLPTASGSGGAEVEARAAARLARDVGRHAAARQPQGPFFAEHQVYHQLIAARRGCPWGRCRGGRLRGSCEDLDGAVDEIARRCARRCDAKRARQPRGRRVRLVLEDLHDAMAASVVELALDHRSRSGRT